MHEISAPVVLGYSSSLSCVKCPYDDVHSDLCERVRPSGGWLSIYLLSSIFFFSIFYFPVLQLVESIYLSGKINGICSSDWNSSVVWASDGFSCYSNVFEKREKYVSCARNSGKKTKQEEKSKKRERENRKSRANRCRTSVCYSSTMEWS